MGVRDPLARAHCERVAMIVDRMATARGWSDERAARLVDVALVHDVGGSGEGHAVAVLAADIAAEALSPEQAAWIRGHRERWDGAGGPDRHAGEAIPDGARLLAVADRWDALTAPLPGGEGLSHGGGARRDPSRRGHALLPRRGRGPRGAVGPATEA